MNENSTQVTGTRVKGEAKPGDRVTYFDMMNQDGTIWEVIDRTGPAEYLLVSGDGATKSSDLRQHGWTRA